MTDIPTRLVLEGVPRVSFYEGGPVCPEDIPFPSVMRALMEYLHQEDFGCRPRHTLKPGRNVSTIVRQLASEFREQLPALGCSQAVGIWTTENGVGCPHTHSHYDDCGRLIQTSSGKHGGLGSPRTKRSGCAA